ncbi:MAG: hypothetical protein DWQ02_10145 [Bacteroidetes bacterium]|nr:MAG: hypothetical protein DWQ02_10145 [Bacteroidota bacterium]
MKNIFAFLILLSGLVMLSTLGCTKNKTMEEVIPDLCDTIDVAYNDEIKTLINLNCSYSGCHDGNLAGIGNFTNYEGLLSRLENGSIKSHAIDLPKEDPDHMPPYYTPAGNPTDLTTEEADMLLCWILSGYPED